MDGPVRLRETVDHHDLLVALDDPERVWHIGRPRHTGHEALNLRVVGPAVLKVLLLLGQCLRGIRNFVTDHHPLSRRNRPDGARINRPSRCRVVLDVPVGRAERLPDPI